MRAGSLRERVRVEARTRQPDGEGGEIEGWAVVISARPARIITKSGSETLLGERLSGRLLKEVHMRASSDTSGITSDMRAVDDRTGEVFNIRTVHRDERARMVVLSCASGVAA